MKYRSKRYKEAEKLVDRTKHYTLKEAVETIQKLPKSKFDESIAFDFQLGIRPEQANEMVRGTIALPHGSGRKVRVLCFAKGEAQKEAQDAGADFVGAEDYVKKIEGGWLDFDAIVAHPEMMRVISKLGKVLGPRGLMPTPKTGTVTTDVGKAVKEIKAGRIEFKNDKTAGVHVACGKLSFSKESLADNIHTVVKAIRSAKPVSSKGDYFRGAVVAPSQGPAIPLSLAGM